MKKTFLLTIALVSVIAAAAQVKPLTEGNLIIYRVGDVHSAADINTYNACPIYLDEYDVSGEKAVLVQSVAMPPKTIGVNNRLVAKGKEILEGWISLSDNGKYVVVAGYDAPLGIRIHNTPAAETGRVVALVDADGKVNSSFKANNPFNENSYRSAATVDGSSVWMSGGGVTGNGGIFHLTAGSNEAVQIGGASIRQLKFHDGDLYASDGTRIYRLEGASAAKQNAKFRNITGEPYFKNGTAFTFVELPADTGVEKLLYVTTFEQGVMKYSWVKNAWVNNGSYQGIDYLTGVEARVENGKVELYLISSRSISGGGDAVLYKVTDEAGHNRQFDPGTPRVMLNADRGTTFRNAVWAPKK